MSHKTITTLCKVFVVLLALEGLIGTSFWLASVTGAPLSSFIIVGGFFLGLMGGITLDINHDPE